jgi:hypothetical protein
MLAQDLVGAWHLRSAIGHDNNDNVFYPMGKDLSGHIVYTADGYVSVNIMSNGRHRSHPDVLWVAVDDAEAGTAARGYMAYSGHYVIDEESRTVFHDLELALDPAMIGTRQVRHVGFTDEGELTLSAPLAELEGQPVKSVVLTWFRDTVSRAATA